MNEQKLTREPWVKTTDEQGSDHRNRNGWVPTLSNLMPALAEQVERVVDKGCWAQGVAGKKGPLGQYCSCSP